MGFGCGVRGSGDFSKSAGAGVPQPAGKVPLPIACKVHPKVDGTLKNDSKHFSCKHSLCQISANKLVRCQLHFTKHRENRCLVSARTFSKKLTMSEASSSIFFERVFLFCCGGLGATHLDYQSMPNWVES